VDDQARKLEYGRYVAASLKRWMDEKWKSDSICPICAFKAWGTGGAEPLPLFGQSGPVVPLICANCGYTILIYSDTLGLLSREEFEDPVMRERLDEARQERGDGSTG
jgi:hypothetical protein